MSRIKGRYVAQVIIEWDFGDDVATGFRKRYEWCPLKEVQE